MTNGSYPRCYIWWWSDLAMFDGCGTLLDQWEWKWRLRVKAEFEFRAFKYQTGFPFSLQ